MSNSAHELRSPRARSPPRRMRPAAPERRLADALEDQVDADAQRADDALAEAVVGDVAQAELLALRARRACRSARRTAASPRQWRAAGRRRPPPARAGRCRRPRPCPGSRPGAATSETSSMPDGSPSPPAADADELEQDVAGDVRGLPALTQRALELGDRSARARLLAEHDADDLRLQLLRRARAQLVLAQAPTTRPCLRIVTRSPIEIASCSLCVMKTSATPASLRPDEHLLQLRDALRRQHRGRLVEDQDAGAPPQRLDDLDLLLLAEREIAGARRRLDVHCRASRRARRAAPRRRPCRGARRCPRRASGSRARSAPGRASSAGRPCRRPGRARCAASRSLTSRPATRIAPGVGLRHPRQHAHQRGLAGAVLAEQAVHLAARIARLMSSFATTPG